MSKKIEAKKFENEEDIIGKFVCKFLKALGLTSPKRKGYFV